MAIDVTWSISFALIGRNTIWCILVWQLYGKRSFLAFSLVEIEFFYESIDVISRFEHSIIQNLSFSMKKHVYIGYIHFITPPHIQNIIVTVS